MDRNEYIEAGMTRLQRLNDVDPADVESLKQSFGHCFDDKFTLTDAVRWMRCTEEVNPELSEERALARMAEIAAPYFGTRRGGKVVIKG